MAKLRIFVSSTYYDLRHIRNSLSNFIESMGYEPVLFEEGSIPFLHDRPLDVSCYDEISNCHIFILIIGGRYGSPSSEAQEISEKDRTKQLTEYNSITKKEYEKARSRDIPVFIFIERGVFSEYQTYKNNRDNRDVKYAHVDNISVFKLCDDIISQRRNNYIREFDRFDDMTLWLKEQWAGLFADFLSKDKDKTTLSDLNDKVSELGSITEALKKYTETIMKKVLKEETFSEIIKEQDAKILSERISRFSRETLPSYILEFSNSGISATELYYLFMKSDSLAKILRKKIFKNANPTVHFLSENKSAIRDFKTIKKEYFDHSDSDDDEIEKWLQQEETTPESMETKTTAKRVSAKRPATKKTSTK